MSRDGTLPPGTELCHVDWAFGGVEPSACSHCFEDLRGGETEPDLCDPCAAKHFRSLYRNALKGQPHET